MKISWSNVWHVGVGLLILVSVFHVVARIVPITTGIVIISFLFLVTFSGFITGFIATMKMSEIVAISFFFLIYMTFTAEAFPLSSVADVLGLLIGIAITVLLFLGGHSLTMRLKNALTKHNLDQNNGGDASGLLQ